MKSASELSESIWNWIGNYFSERSSQVNKTVLQSVLAKDTIQFELYNAEECNAAANGPHSIFSGASNLN